MVYHYAYNDGFCNFADGIYIANIDGSRPRAVTPLSSTSPRDSQPVFSPDATKVAFQRGRYVYTINANGTGRHQLVVGSAPSWQPLP
jgi:Tol biopolymer transport system component